MNDVALLAEGVDRNKAEMEKRGLFRVALLAEGVDRNLGTTGAGTLAERRPPRGGRG